MFCKRCGSILRPGKRGEKKILECPSCDYFEVSDVKLKETMKRSKKRIDVVEKAEKYIGKKNITFKELNNFYFEKAKITDFDDFVIFIGYLYNQFCFYYPSHISFKVNNPQFMTITKNTRSELDYEELTKIINIDLFCDLYFYLRLVESKNKLILNNTDLKDSRQALNRSLKTLDLPSKVEYIESQVRRFVLNQKLY